MSGDEPGATGITQRELLLEMREDIRGLKAAVDAIARDQALGVERRAELPAPLRYANAPVSQRTGGRGVSALIAGAAATTS